MTLDVQAVRRDFPALQELFDGRPAIFFDNPGGTQVPQRVIDAMTDYMIRRNANVGGYFTASRRTDETIEQARIAAADLLGAEPDEVVFGNNMTSLAYQISRALTAEIQAGDEIIVTRLDHDANVAPWITLGEDTGATVHFVDIDMETCTVDMADMQAKISPRTKLVAVGYSSNATGSITDVKTVIEWAKQNGAYTFIDAVQYAPHGLIDVKLLDCDFLACSAYKFFGPHVGVLYGKREHLSRMRSYNVRPASVRSPGRWETGTKNHEGLAGTKAAIDYIADLGVTYGGASLNATRREKLVAAWSAIHAYEQTLIEKLLRGLLQVPGVRVYGLTEPSTYAQRVATVSLRKSGTTPAQIAETFASNNIHVWDGDFYAVSLTERLGLDPSGGLLRIGLAHYNTVEEIDRCLEVLNQV